MESVNINDVAQAACEKARAASSGRAATTIHGGRNLKLRQTIIALKAGHELAEHESPGEATLLVLTGQLTLHVGAEHWTGAEGDYLHIPAASHSVTAVSDTTFMLTVAKA